MEPSLNVGMLLSGREFALPLDYQVHTAALIGIRGSGKTVGATDLAEEMLEHGLQFVTIDPVGVWWGLRCKPDGTPSNYSVVVIGGSHGDLPLDDGARIADAILENKISCVIDMSSMSKNSVRKFVTDFCDRLMDSDPSGTLHIFLEESPELVPQKPMGEQKRSLAAVDRLVRLGRNKGYGCTLVSQRFATINKDVLTQCENLVALRCIGKNDRDAAASWIAEVVHDTESEKKAEKFVQSLTILENGSAWFWSPQWLKEFVQFQFRRRKTLHPGETRQVGQTAKQVQLVDVSEFVERFKRTMQRSSTAQRKSDKADDGRLVKSAKMAQNDRQAAAEIERLTEQLSQSQARCAKLMSENSELTMHVDRIRRRLEPEYREMQALFGDLQTAGGGDEEVAAVVNALQPLVADRYKPWKDKYGGFTAKAIDILVRFESGLTRSQLVSAIGCSDGSSMHKVVTELKACQLLIRDGSLYRIKRV